ncbi:hypothetical protein HY642_02080 [Candidatus Woesearchaeota archaeon]|nr:hypothetical protein [Candidatus Woesearchaeota archaeon]
MRWNIWVGGLFILLSAAGATILVRNGVPEYLLWFCNHTTLIMGIALILRSPTLLAAELYIAVIPQMVWSADFLVKRFFGTDLLGISNYMFNGYPADMYYFSLSHLVIVPVALYALWALGRPDAKAWNWAIFHGTLLFVVSLLVFPAANLNCVHKSCLPGIGPGPQYAIAWLAAGYAIVSFTNLALKWMLWKSKN